MALPARKNSMPYALQVTALEPTRVEDKAVVDKRDQDGTHVSVLEAGRASPGRWSAPLLGCFSSCVPNCCLVTFCPCISLAQVGARLGSSFEAGVISFGLMVTALLLCAGLLLSSGRETHVKTQTDALIDGYAHPQKPSVPTAAVVAVAAIDALLLAAVTARLRLRTRAKEALAGSALKDLALSLACCPCVLAQMATQLDTYTPGVCSLAPALEPRGSLDRDELPAYMAGPPSRRS